MDNKLRQISDLLSQLNAHIAIINNIIYEMNNIISENNIINISINNTINSLNECAKKINKTNYNINLNTSIQSLDKDSPNIFRNVNEKINVIFKNLGKERSFIYDSNTPLNKILRTYLEETGSLRMPKKPIFLYKGCSLNPNDRRKIRDITKDDDFEITVDFF